MRLLLDTHVLIWAVIEPKRLRARARAALEDPGNEVLFSAASAWEMAIKSALGRADFHVAPETIIEAAVAIGFLELPVRTVAALRVASLPSIHRDPFDRLLIAQAVTEPATLYTADFTLAAYGGHVVLI